MSRGGDVYSVSNSGLKVKEIKKIGFEGSRIQGFEGGDGNLWDMQSGTQRQWPGVKGQGSANKKIKRKNGR